MSPATSAYTPDILGPDFEQLRIEQPADYEGPVVCTLVRRTSSAATGTGRAVLYVHGFNDYFFQRELAAEWEAHGYRFYALDLRKYGRAILPQQRPNNVRDLREYFPDLDAALAVIRQEGAGQVVLNAHSTGGLIAALHADAHPGAWAALVLNSPFLELNQPRWLRQLVVPLVTRLGRLLPNLPVPNTLPLGYGESLHRAYYGEWDFDPRYKPFNEEYFQADGVLNAADIGRLAPRLGPRVTAASIEGGMHDLVLSRPAVRQQVYQRMFRWLAEALPAEGRSGNG